MQDDGCVFERERAVLLDAVAERLRVDLAAELAAQDPVARDRVAAAADRAAAAADRYAAALDRRRAAEHLERSCRDALTGALARDAGLERLAGEVDRAAREGLPLVVAFVDVDGLKAVNDSQGHLAGDAVLRRVGAALRTGLRSYDLCLRFGGDELVCGLPGSSLEDARVRLRQVQHVLRTGVPSCSVSTGLAALRPGEPLSAVLARADAALYAGRRTALDAG